MKSTKTFIVIIIFAIGIFLQTGAQETGKKPYRTKWVKSAVGYSDEFLTTNEAKRIADNVMLYQHDNGGWEKNIQMADVMKRKDIKRAKRMKADTLETTIDNGATTTEINFLSRMYQATGRNEYKNAAIAGIRYLLKAQYDNGGWPQFYPRPYGYYTHITYNDNAMINVMRTLSNVSEGNKPFEYIEEEIRHKAKIAVDKGVECILNTQYRQNGKLTVWCAQHDEYTLKPAKARAYELPSLSGDESDGIVLFLMSIENPSERVKTAIESAIEWFKRARILGLHHVYFTNDEGKRDYRMETCPQGDFICEPLWARFYTLDTNRPFFSDRDGRIVFSVSDIGYERRNGYKWYNCDGTTVLDEYRKWKIRIGR
ncbi:MAG: pectate lyase [Prevotellaceae bacterium]|nr:pectate lyase [Prevotellaceae bacterium]